jgi:hypothetical protein
MGELFEAKEGPFVVGEFEDLTHSVDHLELDLTSTLGVHVIDEELSYHPSIDQVFLRVGVPLYSLNQILCILLDIPAFMFCLLGQPNSHFMFLAQRGNSLPRLPQLF